MILSVPFCPYHFVPYHFVLELPGVMDIEELVGLTQVIGNDGGGGKKIVQSSGGR